MRTIAVTVMKAAQCIKSCGNRSRASINATSNIRTERKCDLSDNWCQTGWFE